MRVNPASWLSKEQVVIIWAGVTWVVLSHGTATTYTKTGLSSDWVFALTAISSFILAVCVFLAAALLLEAKEVDVDGS